jgi:hypothetical protein
MPMRGAAMILFILIILAGVLLIMLHTLPVRP